MNGRVAPVRLELGVPADAGVTTHSATQVISQADCEQVTPLARPEPAPPGSFALPLSPTNPGETVLSAPPVTPRDADTSPIPAIAESSGTDPDFEAWRDRWSDKSDQVAYRLTLIDAQFEELLRSRELPPTLPGPVTTDREPIVSPLLSEL